MVANRVKTILKLCLGVLNREANQIFLLITLVIFSSLAKLEADASQGLDSPSNPMLEISFEQPSQSVVTFSADEPLVSLLVKSYHVEWVELNAHLIAENIEGIKSQSIVADDSLFLAPGESKKLQMQAPKGGFFPGHYRVAVNVDGKSERSLEFEIVHSEEVKEPSADSPDSDTNQSITSQQPTPASNPEPDSTTKLPSGFNLALQAIGGKLEHWISQKDDKDLTAENLIDGTCYQTIGGDPMFYEICGWRAGSDGFPQELVFSFNQGREALVIAILLSAPELGAGLFTADLIISEGLCDAASWVP